MARSFAHRFPSPLRYPGGKGKVANFIKLVMIENGLVGCDYVEPYAGGATVALSLLFEEYADHIHINDLNRSVYKFWLVVLERTEELCDRIAKVRVTPNEWLRQLDVQDHESPEDLDLAFSTFFLNRTSRSGIIGGGVIGGKQQAGRWKLDVRFNKEDLIRRIRRIARFRNRITLTGLDTADYIRDCLPGLQSPFVYLDPPYYVKGEGLYLNFYRHSDHVEIAGLVGELKIPWIVSYDGAPEIEAMYSAHASIEYDLHYSAGRPSRGRELMFLSDSLTIPRVESPANISMTLVNDVRVAYS